MNPLQCKVTDVPKGQLTHAIVISRPRSLASRATRSMAYYNAAGEALYVGKARACGTVSAAISPPAQPPHRCPSTRPKRLEVIVTDSVMEAGAREHLIKRDATITHPSARDRNYPTCN